MGKQAPPINTLPPCHHHISPHPATTGRRPVLPDPPARSSFRAKHIPSCPDRINRLGSLTPLHIAAWYDDAGVALVSRAFLLTRVQVRVCRHVRPIQFRSTHTVLRSFVVAIVLIASCSV